MPPADGPNGTPGVTDRDLVLAHRPTARVESRVSPRTRRPQYHVVWVPAGTGSLALGLWCGTEVRAWESACLRLGLRLHRRR